MVRKHNATWLLLVLMFSFLETLTMVQSLVNQSPDIQKILAFEGAFEKLFNIVQLEGGLEGGPVVHDALVCVDNLLRFNSSNQVFRYFLAECVAILTPNKRRRVISARHHSLRSCPRYFYSLRLFLRMKQYLKVLHCNSGNHRRNAQTRT